MNRSCLKEQECSCLSCRQIKNFDDNLLRESVFLVGDCKNQTNELCERAIRENIYTLYRLNDKYRQSDDCINFILNNYINDINGLSRAFQILYSLIKLKYESLEKILKFNINNNTSYKSYNSSFGKFEFENSFIEKFIVLNQEALNIINKSDELVSMFLRLGGNLKHIYNQNDKVCKLAVELTPENLEFVINKSPEICELASKHSKRKFMS